jgi:hypothetical protein
VVSISESGADTYATVAGGHAGCGHARDPQACVLAHPRSDQAPRGTVLARTRRTISKRTHICIRLEIVEQV